MVTIENAINRVDPTKVYSVSEMRKDNLFPWISANNQNTYIHAIVDDMFGDDLLKAKTNGSGRGRRYIIKGKNIIKYLEKKNHEKST